MELTGSYDRPIAEVPLGAAAPEAPEQVKKQARSLPLRLGRREEKMIRFLTDFKVAFVNNQAERALR